ncbi:MAG: 3-hydroxybutyryl-CoA dehydrogenase [Deltaproteobacteria bacterium CG11_big_fil_rev_8_21_14_0_20_47_16]|nr:MAG: 3-hydroxybutyryl-CoA dehydrogenase [Deltaproteobacteria bacterium CG11_big_fil_rev_8_21_14_0_20_47_16]
MPKVIGVVGAGQMGAGIAQVFAQSGFDVLLLDTNEVGLQKAVQSIRTSLEKFAAKGKIPIDAVADIMAHLRTTAQMSDFAAADVVIEAVTEDLKVKSQLFKSLDQILKADAILASNTSSISIAKLAEATQRPGKVIGMHFMNPVPLMPCVEVIVADATNDTTFETIKGLVTKLGKTMVVSKDRAGFIVNRILMPMINEAAYAVQENLASVQDIDTAMKLSCNFPMGPLTLADFIGLDTVVNILDVMQDGLVDPKFKPCPLLLDYVQKGWLGRKSGKGFYQY